MEVHEKIKLLRLTKDWSQEDVAIKLEMSPNGYGSIERGETDVNLSRLKQIAQIFGVAASSLFDDGQTVFNFNGNAQNSACGQHNQSHFMGACSPEYLQLQSECEKQQMQLEMKDKELAMQQREIDNLREQVLQLKEINTLLKKEV
jgi:transcriptional regulator with XRE-family HTH domain